MNPGAARDALTLVAGVVTGVLSGAFGVGGAVISTPAVRALGASAFLAVGTTLPSIFPSALTGSVRYTRERLVDWSIVRWTAPYGLGASVAGSLLSHVIPGHGHVLMVLTAGLIAFTASRMIRAQDAGVDEAARARMAAGPGAAEASGPEADLGEPGKPHEPGAPGEAGSEPAHRRALIGATGIVAGALSGLLGVGGGVILVPAYAEVLGLPIKTAIATSLVSVGIFAVPSTISHALLGDIDWTFAVFLAIGVVPGAWLGSSLATRASDHRLRLAVGALLGLVSIVYAAGEIAALV
jgi:uncharacterized membrane protein YfcA